MLEIRKLIVPLKYDSDMLKNLAAKKLRIDSRRIISLQIKEKAVETKDINNIFYKITVLVSLSGNEDEVLFNRSDKTITKYNVTVYEIKTKKFRTRPVIAGFGPAGMFAGLILAKAGAKPVILEKGKDIDQRTSDVIKFWDTGVLNENSNVQFGEGGAGAFSDGKLKTGKKDPIKMYILNELVLAGAPEEIKYLEKPHIGTDILKDVVKNIRKKIIEYGGEILFSSEFFEMTLEDSSLKGVSYIKDNNIFYIETDTLIIASGNSSRSTIRYLYNAGVKMEPKPVSVGVRIEHPRKYIDNLVYGKFSSLDELKAADYKMVVHLPDKRNVYTFCMCPGGMVIGATSEFGSVVTNGMSKYARNSPNSNTALLVTTRPSDFPGESPLKSMYYQEKIEKDAFVIGGKNYYAPVQKLEDFLHDTSTANIGSVTPSYRPGYTFSNTDNYLPSEICDSLKKALKEMDEWMPGYIYPDAVITGAETRSSSPVRILRKNNYESVNINGLYFCGEGSGYSGGIISAANDGVLCAESIM